MQRTEPQTYAVLDNFFEYTKEALVKCDDAYPKSSDIHGYLDEDVQEEVPNTTFGWVMSTLNELGAVESYNDETHDTNRYDLTELDTDYLDSIETALEHGVEG